MNNDGTAALPAALEAEQALIGAVLFDNMAFVEADLVVTADQFSEPLHQRLWACMARLVKADRRAEPSILAQMLGIDPAFKEFGGLSYLMDLIDKAPPADQARHFALLIADTATRAEVVRIATEIARQAAGSSEVSGSDLVASMESQLLNMRGYKSEITLVSLGDATRSVLYDLENPSATTALLPIGLARIDKLTGGFEAGDMVVLAGRPSMGKSALALSMAKNVAKSGFSVSEINGEMTVKQMARRHMVELAFEKHGFEAPFYSTLKKGEQTYDQFRMLAQQQELFESLPLFMASRAGITLSQLRGLILRQKLKAERTGCPLKMVVVDHAGLIKTDKPMRNRLDEQTVISGTLKQMAQELGVVMLVLSQLNRGVEHREDKRPGLADLRDSGSWEQDADVVLGVYRDAYYAGRETEPKNDMDAAQWMARCKSKEVEVIALKIREGDVGTARLWASIGHNVFLDNEPDFFGRMI